MGGNQSVEVPGGGSEGYHVLKARVVVVTNNFSCSHNNSVVSPLGL